MPDDGADGGSRPLALLGADDAEPRRIVRLVLDEALGGRRSPEIEQERAIAIYDLLETNSFRLADGRPGPYDLQLGLDTGRLLFRVRDAAGADLATIGLALGPFRRTIRDYFAVCESYYDAIRRLAPSQIEAIDMGRRSLHDEGSRLLQDRLAGKAEIDFQTARRLFTLVCVLHVRR